MSPTDLLAILERGPPVWRESDLPDANPTLYTLDAQRGRKRWRPLTQSSDEHRQHREEGTLKLSRHTTKLAIKVRQALEGRHAYAG